MVQRRHSRFSTTESNNVWKWMNGSSCFKIYEFWRRTQNSYSYEYRVEIPVLTLWEYTSSSYLLSMMYSSLRISYENYSYFVSSDICFWYLWFVVRMNTVIDFEHHWIRNFIWVGWPVVILSNLLRLSWRIKKEWKRLAVDAVYIEEIQVLDCENVRHQLDIFIETSR